MSVSHVEAERTVIRRRPAGRGPATQPARLSAEHQTVGRSALAKLLRISPSSLDRMRADGTFAVEPIAMFGQPHWSRAEVARWLGADPTMPDSEYSLLTLAEVARLLAVSRATAYRLRTRSAFSSVEICVGQEARYPRCRITGLLGKEPIVTDWQS